MKNDMITDYGIRKSFVDINFPFKSPSILLDGYWEHYMDIFGQEEKYENFKKDWIAEGFKTYEDFRTAYGEILSSINFADVFKYPINEVIQKIESLSYENTWMPVIQSWEYVNLKGKYLQVDLHHAFETVFRISNVYRDEYESIKDVIRTHSSHKMFTDLKLCRLNIYNNKLQLRHKQIIFDMCGNLLKRIFGSDHPVITELNRRYEERILSTGDMYLYKIGENDDISDFTGDYEVDGIEFSISPKVYRNISVLDSIYSTSINPDAKLIDYNIAKTCTGGKQPYFLDPILLRLARGEQPTEMDLAVGYEDRVFFHLNENDYKIL